MHPRRQRGVDEDVDVTSEAVMAMFLFVCEVLSRAPLSSRYLVVKASERVFPTDPDEDGLHSSQYLSSAVDTEQILSRRSQTFHMTLEGRMGKS